MRMDKDHDEEHVNLDEYEGEEMMEEEVEDEEEKNNLQEGLDLDIAEDEGNASQDEQEIEQNEQNENLMNSPYHNDEFEENGKDDMVEESGAKGNSENNANRDEPTDEELLARPPHGTEIFIANLPRDTSNDELRTFCEQCGEVFEVIIKGEPSKQEYAFITYTSKESAKKALETLNGQAFKEKKLRISESQPKNRLFVSNIPHTLNDEELSKSVSEQGPGFQRLELIKDPKDSSRNRGFAFVEFYNKGCAEKALKNMIHSKFKLDDKVITVKWASAQRNSSSEEVKAIYVRNIPEQATEEQLKEVFGKHGTVTKVVLMEQKPGQPKRDFGFVHFDTHSSAVKASEKSEKYEVEGKELSVSLARPMIDKRAPNMGSNNFQRPVIPNFPTNAGYPYGGNMFRGMGMGYGGSGYSQPVIYGRGPTPEGMMMVPMVLPDGRIGYVLQQPGAMLGGAAPYGSQPSGRHRERPSSRSSRGNSGSSRHGNSRSSGGGNSHRYNPY